MELIDKASGIRKGEELPKKEIETFIRDEIKGLEGPIAIRQFPGGHSNLTYLITSKGREMVLRCPPHGTKAKSAHDMGREYRILTALEGHYPYCPKPLAFCEDESILGAPFYLMERLQGIIIRHIVPEKLSLSPQDTRRLFKSVLKAQYDLHAVDYEAAGLGHFGKPTGYVRRQVEGWSGRFRAALTPGSDGAEDVMDWLGRNMPEESPKVSVIHNDFKFDNVVLDPQDPFRVIGVLDWEMATIGDPLMDLGCSLGYWVEPCDPDILNTWRDVPSNAPGALTRKEMVTAYETLSGNKIDHFSFYHAFGVFRLAVIVQQIYFRWYHGQTTDKRFESWDKRVNALVDMARRITLR